jgi:hypothetical protein
MFCRDPRCCRPASVNGYCASTKSHRLDRTEISLMVASPNWAPRTCWDILGIKPGSGEADIDRAFRDRAKTAHPDRGGSDSLMAELNKARADALAAAR